MFSVRKQVDDTLMILRLRITEPEGSTHRCDSLTPSFSPLFHRQIQLYPPSIIVHCQVTHNSLFHTKYTTGQTYVEFHIMHIITLAGKVHHVQICHAKCVSSFGYRICHAKCVVVYLDIEIVTHNWGKRERAPF